MKCFRSRLIIYRSCIRTPFYATEVVDLLTEGIWIFGGIREGRMFRTSVDVGDKTRGECRWRLFRVSGGETRRDRAVVVVMVAVVGAEGDDAPLRWWVRDVSSFQRRGTLTSGLTNPGERISPMTDPAFCRRWYRRVVPSSGLFLACLVSSFDPARAIKRNQDATNNHEKLSTGYFRDRSPSFYNRFIDW